MAILKIARMGHPVLAQAAHPVPDPTAPEIRRLVNDMVETMMDANGAGLAAPQVHIPLRIVILQAPGERADPGVGEIEKFDHTAPLTCLINPEILVVDARRRKAAGRGVPFGAWPARFLSGGPAISVIAAGGWTAK